jgi:hypothetical protein
MTFRGDRWHDMAIELTEEDAEWRLNMAKLKAVSIIKPCGAWCYTKEESPDKDLHSAVCFKGMERQHWAMAKFAVPGRAGGYEEWIAAWNEVQKHNFVKCSSHHHPEHEADKSVWHNVEKGYEGTWLKFGEGDEERGGERQSSAMSIYSAITMMEWDDL